MINDQYTINPNQMQAIPPINFLNRFSNEPEASCCLFHLYFLHLWISRKKPQIYLPHAIKPITNSAIKTGTLFLEVPWMRLRSRLFSHCGTGHRGFIVRNTLFFFWSGSKQHCCCFGPKTNKTTAMIRIWNTNIFRRLTLYPLAHLRSAASDSTTRVIKGTELFDELDHRA